MKASPVAGGPRGARRLSSPSGCLTAALSSACRTGGAKNRNLFSDFCGPASAPPAVQPARLDTPNLQGGVQHRPHRTRQKFEHGRLARSCRARKCHRQRAGHLVIRPMYGLVAAQFADRSPEISRAQQPRSRLPGPRSAKPRCRRWRVKSACCPACRTIETDRRVRPRPCRRPVCAVLIEHMLKRVPGCNTASCGVSTTNGQAASAAVETNRLPAKAPAGANWAIVTSKALAVLTRCANRRPARSPAARPWSR